MYKYLNIEFFKLRNTRYFWVLLACFVFFIVAVPIATKILVNYLAAQGETIMDVGIGVGQLPLFDFVDLWQNLTWVYSKFSILLGFIVVISVSNEYSYGTVKQNIIDGLSRRQFLWSKVGYIMGISALASLFVLLFGLLIGLLWSPVKGIPFIVKNLEFIPAYFLQLVGVQLFCLMITLLVKRSGFVIALLIFYTYIMEPILGAIIKYQYDMPWLSDLLPLNAISGMIHIPFTKYALMETQTHIAIKDVCISLIYIATIGWGCLRITEGRDLS